MAAGHPRTAKEDKVPCRVLTDYPRGVFVSFDQRVPSQLEGEKLLNVVVQVVDSSRKYDMSFAGRESVG